MLVGNQTKAAVKAYIEIIIKNIDEEKYLKSDE